MDRLNRELESANLDYNKLIDFAYTPKTLKIKKSLNIAEELSGGDASKYLYLQKMKYKNALELLCVQRNNQLNELLIKIELEKKYKRESKQ